MRPGARGGWINGSLTWSGFDAWYAHSGEHRPDHVALVRELHAAQRARQGRGYYHYGSEKTVDLSDCGPQLWSLLDEAARIGLPLIDAGGQASSRPTVTARSRSTSRAPPMGTRKRVRRCASTADGLEPVLFLGSEGHGVVCAGPSPLLVRLAHPAAPPLQRMVLDGQRLAIPASELERFATEISPALGRVATLVSSDGSFAAPEVSAPALTLRARYGERHAVELGWEWLYRVGTAERRAPLTIDTDGLGFRDPQAERAAIAATAFAETGLAHFGLLDAGGRPAHGPGLTLIGLESMRFATELLPRLRELPGVTVEVDGDPPDYRDVGDSLEIGVSTADIEGERDWFDLGVTIRVDGRELPFADVFVALANGHSQMLLDDGAHFSLLEPRLQSLRALIEEARALADSPSEGLRISRYQAGLWDELTALGVVTEQAQAWQRQVGALLELDTIAEHAPPATLHADLRPYQRDGFAWLAALWELELGGILADDMGLGKTLQALALICHARERDCRTRARSSSSRRRASSRAGRARRPALPRR